MALMNELSKRGRFIEKRDVVSFLKGKLSENEVSQTLEMLCEDGAIHSGYNNDVYSVTD